MGKAQLQCPNCQGAVTLGEVTCPHCGVNLKSGESYETQVKRARGKAKHQEMYTGGLYAGIVFAVALCIFAGYMYQRAMANVLVERADLFTPLVKELQQARDLADAGQAAEARKVLQGDGTPAKPGLIRELQEQADAIKPEVAWSPQETVNSYYTTTQKKEVWDKRGAKRLLFNMQAKAQYILDHLPAA